MSLHEKVVKELGYGMNMPNETDVAFVALWVSRRADGSLNPTMCHIEEEPLTDELREHIATVLRNLANVVSAQHRLAADLSPREPLPLNQHIPTESGGAFFVHWSCSNCRPDDYDSSDSCHHCGKPRTDKLEAAKA